MMITDPDRFFAEGCGRCARFQTDDCSARIWGNGLAALRTLCLEAGLTETAKWGHPCYVFAGRNIAILGAFRGDVRLTFFNAALLSVPMGALTRQGENTRHPDCIRFTSAADIPRFAPMIRDLLELAKSFALAGTLPPKDTSTVDLPEELVAALDADPVLAEAFHALTPGRQKSHALAIGSAKASATREARVVKLSPLILAGKGALDR